jgi:hypothetical protein
MATKTRPTGQVLTADADPDAPALHFYRSDASSGAVARVVVHIPAPDGSVVETLDVPMSSITSLSGAQKTALRAALQAIYAEVLTLKGYT